MITPLLIETAPKDGRLIFAYDGTWWRRARWKKGGDGIEAWLYQGWLPIYPIQWYPINLDYEELMAEVADGEKRQI